MTYPDEPLPLGTHLVRHTLHVPLHHRDRELGVLTLGRSHDRAFIDAEVKAIEELARLAGATFSNALALESARRLASSAAPCWTRPTRRSASSTPWATRSSRTQPWNGWSATTASCGRRALRRRARVRGSDDRSGAVPPQTSRRCWPIPSSSPGTSSSLSPADLPAVLRARARLTRRCHRTDLRPQGSDGGALGARAREDLIATVSHELRTPLTGILGFAEILLDQDVRPDVRRRHLETIHGEVKRLPH